MNTSTLTKKKSNTVTKWLKIIFAIFVGLYLIIWAISSPVSKHFIEPILLEEGVILSDDSSIRYNPFLSQLTVSDLTFYKNAQGKQERVLSIENLTVRLTLYRLMFDKIKVSEFTLDNAYLKVDKTPTQLIIAGFDLNKKSTDETPKEVVESDTQPLPYELVLPLLSINQFEIEINNESKPHHIDIEELLISNVIASQLSQQAKLSLVSAIDKTKVSLNADAEFVESEGNVNSKLSVTNYPINKLQRYVAQLSELSGSLSLTSEQQIVLSQEAINLHVSQANLINKDLILGYEDQFVNLESFENTINDLKLALSQGEITELSGTSQLTLNNASVHHEKPSQQLAYFEKLALQDISFHFEDEPQVKIANFVIDNIVGSKNEDSELPPIVTLKQFHVNDIIISEKQLAINTVSLDSLQSDIIIDKEQALANLVSLPITEEEKEVVEGVADEVKKEINDEIKDENAESKSAFIISLNEFSLLNENHITVLNNSVEPIKTRKLFIDTLNLGAISTAPEKLNEETPFAIKGRSNKYAHFDFKGFTKPFAQQPTHHLEGFLKELSLPAISRYMKKAVQMELKSGQLNTDVNVTLTGEELDGNVVILLRGLETELADSDEAGALIDKGALPFNMAIGMLKDSNGDVELDVPLSGSTSDPSFGVSSIVSLITQKAIWMATQDYLMTTFVPYANIVSVAMTVGEFALKLRFDDLMYQTKQIEPDDKQKAYLDAFIALMQNKDDTRVNICAISTPADIDLTGGVEVTDKKQIERLKEIGEKREAAFKDYIIEQGKIPSSRLLLCLPKIDSSKDAQPRIELSV